jgi:hypothetical protein
MYGAVAMALTMGVIQLGFIYLAGLDFWTEIVQEHFAATVGLSGALMVSFGVVVLRQSEGPIEFEAVGMKFRGAAGQVVLWLLCVAVLTLCGKLLW